MEERIKIYFNSNTENFELTYQDLIIKRGNTKNIFLKFVDENDISIDITNFIIFFTVKDAVTQSDVEAVIKKDVTEHENESIGLSKIVINPEDADFESATDLLGNYLYDIKIKDSDNNIFTVAEGTLLISQGITQRIEEE